MVSAHVADEAVQRRRGMELPDVREELRRRIDDTPADVEVVVRHWILSPFRERPARAFMDCLALWGVASS
ncbi:hypothetical protein QQY66_03690 [Streptomyces sp. DG2A-72]|uniref:hypothetical protein n=1 Tax=Streptomyces sp. DG2A-72 TaxID=3051386 RepID=UPI00265C1956|nr:hypothetical protein [Streptomyces sp. DG2A-72]MDO0930820.1 hypothetical protein [Streptomyces sp. DG2A-72]